jgi:hypothetical protein
MGSPSYIRSVVDRSVVMRRMTVLYIPPVLYICILCVDLIKNSDHVRSCINLLF